MLDDQPAAFQVLGNGLLAKHYIQRHEETRRRTPRQMSEARIGIVPEQFGIGLCDNAIKRLTPLYASFGAFTPFIVCLTNLGSITFVGPAIDDPGLEMKTGTGADLLFA